jgi:hypothetical protein
MSMEFKLANPSLQSSLEAGCQGDVEFVERQPGEWVITSGQPARRSAAQPTLMQATDRSTSCLPS